MPFVRIDLNKKHPEEFPQLFFHAEANRSVVKMVISKIEALVPLAA